MGPRILHELSQELAILLEHGLRGGDAAGRRMPVYFCHPLDPFEDQPDPAQGTFGILYMTRIVPDPGLRRNAIDGGSLLDVTLQPRLRRPPLWIRVRYVFLVAGGDVESQLIALASALQTLHDHSCVRVRTRAAAAADAGAPEGPFLDAHGAAPDGEGATDGEVFCPLRLIDDGEGWRELGLPEHRLTLAFEATCPIPGAPLEPVERIQERGLSIEESAT